MFSSFSTSNLDDQQYVVLFSIDLNNPQVLYFQVGFWRKSKNKKEFTLLKDKFEVALSHDAKEQHVKEQHQLNLKIFLQKIISQTRYKIKTLITEKKIQRSVTFLTKSITLRAKIKYFSKVFPYFKPRKIQKNKRFNNSII